MRKFGTESGSEDSSSNIFFSCALFFWSDYMEKYIDLALKEAKKAYEKDEVPIGAVIVKDGVVISKAHNLKEKNCSVTKHAELIAIERACKKLKNWRLDGCDIYVTLEPCPMCASAIQQARIQSVYYGVGCGNSETSAIVEKIFHTVDRNKPVAEIVNCENAQCKDLLQKYFKEKRSTNL